MIGEPRCPRCGSTVLGPCDEEQHGSEESFRATHECAKCATRFRYEPPTREVPREVGA
jgi:tRNA(Ile2) C34 agmatinyltransferase TiaS